MSISFSTDPDALAEEVAIALERDGRAQVTGLPAGIPVEPDLTEAWIFDWTDSLELLIPACHRAQRNDGPLARACAGSDQEGGFRLVGRFGRDDDGLAKAIGLLLALVTDTGRAEQPDPTGEPERTAHNGHTAAADLTDLDQALAIVPANAIPPAAELASELSLSVKGQSEALTVISEATVAHLHKVDPRLPLRLLLVGPSGVGKGETYETLAAALNTIGGNGRDWQTVRLDGNQLREATAVADLLGTSAGYVGYGAGSSLIHALSTSPRTLILIDEIDKAHPDIITALMGMMDHGALQLRRPVQGRWSLDCRQAILMFTSNAGSAELVDRMERTDLSGLRLESLARQVLMAQGMPEWIAGRHGHIAVYRPLPGPALAEIATLEVARLAQEFGLELSWVEPDVVALLLHEADAASTGARSVRAATSSLISHALAEHRAHLEAPSDNPEPPDRRVVVAGPVPHCLAYPAWLASDFPSLG